MLQALLWVFAVLIFLGALVAAIWWLPSVLTRHPSAGLTSAARLGAENAARGSLVAAVALVGAAALTARYTWRAAKATLAGQKLDRERQDIDRQGQITDRYTKAIDQLGSDKLDVRIGGIYALEHLAQDSPEDYNPTVMEVLAAFIREHSREAWPVSEHGTRRPLVLRPLTSGWKNPEHMTRPDVQAAITVIGRRDATHDRQPIDLTGVDLTRANLAQAKLSNAKLSNAKLSNTYIAGADLTGANLLGADLDGAYVADANLTEADLTEVNLTRANLAFANLTRANLDRADLTDAYIAGADLTSAYIADANLTGANLTRADLTRAILSPDMPVPEGWQRDAEGRLRRADTNSGDAAKD